MSEIQTRPRAVNTPRQVLFASLMGTTIEFFDFYIYATAAVLVFPRLFFPTSDPAAATLASLATFGVAFLARPIGALLFGHFGDRVGRKTTLVLALAVHGLVHVSRSARCPATRRSGLPRRFCSRCAGSARASDSAANGAGPCCSPSRTPRPAKRAFYGMFPQLGAPVGFLLLGRGFPAALALADRGAVLRLRLAAALSGQRGAGAARALRPPEDHRNARLPGVGQTRANRWRARARRCSAGTGARSSPGCSFVWRRSSCST